MIFENKNKVEVVKNYRIKDPRSDLVWFNFSNQHAVKDSRQDGVRMWYSEMIKFGRVPMAHCLKFNDKYYCPGAVFKLNENWAKENNIKTVLPMHCWTDYNHYINQESLYLEYVYDAYDLHRKHAHFYRRWFPFVNMSEWKKLNISESAISCFFVNEFIKKHNVDKLFSESVDVTIPLTELENALELVDGYEWNLERFQEVSNNNIQENKIALMIYIFAMLGSLILKEPYGLWVIFTVAYFGFTQTMKDRYGGEI